MTKSRFGLVWALGLLVVLLLIGAVAFFVLRKNAQTQHVIELTPDIRLRLAGVLTKENPEIRLSAGGVQVSDTVAKWKAVEFANKYLPVWAQLKPGYAISNGAIKDYSATLVYAVEFPKEWLPTRNVDDIRKDVKSAIDDKKINRLRLKISDGNYGPWQYVNEDIYSYSSSHTVGKSRNTVYHPNLSCWLENLPVFQREIVVEHGNEDYDSAAGKMVSRRITSVTIPNPYYKKVTPLENPEALPATRTNGEFAVTMQALMARVDDTELFANENWWQSIFNRPLPESEPIPTDYFPAGKADDPMGFRTIAHMQVKRNGLADTEWGLISPVVSYGKEDFPAPMGFINAKTVGDSRLFSFPLDLTILPQPIKLTYQLKHTRNFGPDEEQTTELALPKEGELRGTNVDLEIWNRKVKLIAIGYRTTQSLQSVSSHPKAGQYSSMRDHDTTSLMLISETELRRPFEDVKLLGPDVAPLNIGKFAYMCFQGEINTQYYSMINAPHQKVKRTEPFNYGDYTTVSVTLRDGRVSPELYEFVATPQIATGSGAK